MVDVSVRLFDGCYDNADRAGAGFTIAASRAFKEAGGTAGPLPLEPLMQVEAVVPEDYTGEVIADLNSRRGRIQGMMARGNAQGITALVPLAGMFGYATDLRSAS